MSSDKLYTFYKITCTLNGRIYVGCTSKTLESRWSDHKSSIKTQPKTPFHIEASKIGVENFEIELIETGNYNRKTAVTREEELISFYNSRDQGFNSSWSRSKDNNGWYGKGASNDNFTNPSKNPSKGVLQATCKPVNIKGHTYVSVSHAARALGIERSLVSYRIKSASNKFKDWNYIETKTL